MPEISKKAKELSGSPISDQMALAREMLLRGDDVIDLTVGETDADTSDNVKAAAIQAIQSNVTRYTPVSGIKELKDLLAQKYHTSSSCVSVSNGAKSVLHVLMECLFDPDDELILSSPYWPCFYEAAHLSGANVITVTAEEENRLLPTFSQFEKSVTEKTKAILLNSPCNPSGQAYTNEEFSEILDLCKKKNIFCIYDGSYSDLYFDDNTFIDPYLTASDNADVLICVGSASKAWAMSGWRIGWCIAPENVTAAVSKFLSNCIGCPSSVSQIAFSEALKETIPTERIRSACKERCMYVSDRIQRINGLHCIPPKGGLYVFVRIESGYDDIRFTKELLESMEVATVAGSAFGCPGWFRISCSKDISQLEIAMNRLEMFALSKLS